MKADPLDGWIVVRRGDGQSYVADLHGLGGTWPDVSLDQDAEEAVIVGYRRLEQMVIGTLSLEQHADTPVSIATREAGQCLYEMLDVDGSLTGALDLSTLALDRQLRLELHHRDPRAAAWPWELLYDPQATVPDVGFVALRPHLFFSRHQEQSSRIHTGETLDELRVLIVVASPSDLSPIAESATQIGALMTVARTTERVELEILEHATREGLEQHLRGASEPFHVIHFVGHGYADEGSDSMLPSAGVYLEELDGSKTKVEASQFARILLGDEKGPQQTPYPCLVSLSACDSARTTSSVAGALVDAHVPAVIGMRRTAYTPSVILFNEGLYRQLLDGHPIDEVVAECRRQMYQINRHLDWSTPILYLRAARGVLFRFNEHGGERQQWLQKLHFWSELAGNRAAEALESLLKLGTSAVALSVAATLSYPVAAVRATSAALLRALPRTPEVHDTIIDLVGPALTTEPEPAVRYQIAQILLQPRVSPRAEAHLRALATGTDHELARLAGLGLNVPVPNTDAARLLERLGDRLGETISLLEPLVHIANDVRAQDEGYRTYRERLERVLMAVRHARTTILNAKQEASSMSGEEVWERLVPIVSGVVDQANEAMVEAERAVRTARSLASTLETVLDEAAATLEIELEQLRELDAITRELDGVVISDPKADTTIVITRTTLEGNAGLTLKIL